MNKSRKLGIAIVAAAAVGVGVWYIWFRKRRSSSEVSTRSSYLSVVKPTPDGVKTTKSPRPEAGKEEDSNLKKLLQSDYENVKEVFERVFNEQFELGEELIQNDETLEQGAVHMSNAIMLTGNSEQFLEMLKENLPREKYVRVLKYMPTAEIRAQQLLEDELEEETIAAIFG